MELNGYDKKVVQNTIELVPNAKPVRQKYIPISPKMEPVMKQELAYLV